MTKDVKKDQEAAPGISSVMSWNRREFLEYAARGGLVLGAGMTTYSDFARAQGDDEHFMIFLELRGGINWITATDGRNVDALPLDDPKRCIPLKITDTPLTPQEYTDLVQKDMVNRGATNGNFLLLPYIDDAPAASYTKGKTSLDNDYVMGFAGRALLEHVNDIAVVRGVNMIGDFHGINNASGEMFAGLNTAENPHIASIMTSLLTPKHGQKLLDNLVFENATFSTGSSNMAKMPVRLDAESLGYIVANADDVSDETAQARFARARELADGLAKAPGLSELHRKVFDTYVGAMKDAPTVRSMLLKLKNDLGAVDASLDLDIQFKTALTLMQAGLTRVVTLCLGTPNGKNKVDGFGLFDAHVGAYHMYDADPSRANTVRHHLNVDRAMKSVAAFIKTLKQTKFGNSGKSMFDVTTVVIGTEFARPSNFSGNEAFGGEGGTAFGSGHYNFNNNYIFFGKNIKGGSWVGKTDDIRQAGYKVDLSTAGAANANDVKMEPVQFTQAQGGGFGGDPESGGFWQMEQLNYNSEKRPFMAKDLVRTMMASAGFEAKFGEAYSDDRMKTAKAIKCVLKG